MPSRVPSRRVPNQPDPRGAPVPVDTLVGMCALATLATVALVLVLEAGLLIGIVLPAGSLVLGLGVLAGVGVVSLPLVALTVAAATVLGAALGHRAVRRRSGDELL